MKDFLRINYLGTKLIYQLKEGVIKRDYYKDYLVEKLPLVMDEIIRRKNNNISILDMATGNGYTAIIFAKYYKKYIKNIVAYDINPKAVKLAQSNAKLNNCDSIIDFRLGSLYEPLNPREKFDLIVSALPPIPITQNKLRNLPKTARAHHWVKSTGGRTGRKLIDKMIASSPAYLKNCGFILTVHSDFLDCRKTLDNMSKADFDASIVGKLKTKKLKETVLTLASRDSIVNLGYKFTYDKDGDEQFFIGVFLGSLYRHGDSNPRFSG